MAAEWIDRTLMELIDIKHGYAFAGAYIQDEPTGDVLLTPGNFAKGGGFKGEKLKYFNGEVREEFILDEGDLIVTMTDLSKQSDTLGYPAIVPKMTSVRFLHNQRLGKVAIKPNAGVDKRFLFYLFCTPEYRHEVLASATGTTVKHTSPNRILAYKTKVPSVCEQQAIACILGALDDKIELNRRRNRTLEEMARAIFQSWFVDFDPVRAKAAGHPPPGLKPELAALFPDSFEDSPLGPIPKGWRVGKVGEIVRISRDSILPGEYADEVFDHYSIPAFDAGQHPVQESGESIKSQKFNVPVDCVMVSKLNPKTPRVWIPNLKGERRRIASTEFLVCQPTAGSNHAFFYCLSRDQEFSEYLESRASGTSNSHQRVRPNDFLVYDIVIPSSVLSEKFQKQAGALLDQMLTRKSESCTLAALRDTLLPKLISGELRVPDAERIVGRAL